jgi:hypothetical protein
VLFLVLNKANPKQAQFTSIVHYWDLYADDAQLRKKLQLAIGVSGIGLLILLPAGLSPPPGRGGPCTAMPVSPARPRSIARGSQAATASPASSSAATAASSSRCRASSR